MVALVPRMRARQIAWRIALLFGTAGAVTAFAGAAVNRLLPDDVVLGLFAALMVGAGIRMLQEKPTTGAACAVDGGRINWRRCLPRTLAGRAGGRVPDRPARRGRRVPDHPGARRRAGVVDGDGDRNVPADRRGELRRRVRRACRRRTPGRAGHHRVHRRPPSSPRLPSAGSLPGWTPHGCADGSPTWCSSSPPAFSCRSPSYCSDRREGRSRGRRRHQRAATVVRPRRGRPAVRRRPTREVRRPVAARAGPAAARARTASSA